MAAASISAQARVDVAVFGGGVAGLFALHALREAGHDAILIETQGLGSGQSVLSQGIIHGGGKYALRSVADLDSMKAIREMPDRWRASLAGTTLPDLRAARFLSPECWLWIPRGSWRSRIEAWGLVPMLRHAGVLACPPQPRREEEWPKVLRSSALRAYAMAEPVLDTASVLSALAKPLEPHLLKVEADASNAIEFEVDAEGRVRTLRVRPEGSASPLEMGVGAVVFAAGEGNAGLLRAIDQDDSIMQRRPLRMFLVRGMADPLHGHCISGGRTRMTITSLPLPDGGHVWQLGGEIAEREADAAVDAEQLERARAELLAVLPGVDLRKAEMSSYRAVRAEGHHPDHRRPSGVQLRAMRPNVLVAWPTKWALAPLLAEEIVAELADRVVGAPSTQSPAGRDEWPRPEVAPAPWGESEVDAAKREVPWTAVN